MCLKPAGSTVGWVDATPVSSLMKFRGTRVTTWSIHLPLCSLESPSGHHSDRCKPVAKSARPGNERVCQPAPQFGFSAPLRYRRGTYRVRYGWLDTSWAIERSAWRECSSVKSPYSSASSSLLEVCGPIVANFPVDGTYARMTAHRIISRHSLEAACAIFSPVLLFSTSVSCALSDSCCCRPCC